MAGNLQQRLDRLKSKTDLVLARNQALQERLDAAKSLVTSLQEAIRDKDNEIAMRTSARHRQMHLRIKRMML